ncbi:DUF3429 domain-containing protein [Jannaschia aquimarina]|uniref:DUF3429 domain-containing protein n=1 Tax=Jannaschia aquimarina TaxID=935700 RepID=A0A0D1EC85_9RHOB|nr:DUF3429 domain-containing protein [Jannaschia aquimarina]KIT14531.1 hypothetical protein jaqu_38210 [Jannaschia aquimarina]SNT35619.1 Protein of unknown function [Jannaschia aquimarina]
MWTDSPIPRSALILGLAGLLPFAWGAAAIYVPALYEVTYRALGPRFVPPFVLLQYGTVILCFMSGVLWGFATRAEGRVAATGYALSVLPALWAFFMVAGGPISASIALMAGFVGLLGLDWLFWNQGLAPHWWMKLRLILTAVVVLCLLPVAL